MFTRNLFIVTLLIFISACTSVNIDQIRLAENTQVGDGEAILLLRQHLQANIETEKSLVRCLGRAIAKNNPSANVLPEQQFINDFFPWFEPENAPDTEEKLLALLKKPVVAKKIDSLNLSYLIWVRGSTELHDDKLALACSGAGCVGFGSWQNTSNYEAIIWNLESLIDDNQSLEVGRISTDASGTSYLPAIIVPIPVIARVQANACQGMGKELSSFFK